jgi:hypothetical protein
MVELVRIDEVGASPQVEPVGASHLGKLERREVVHTAENEEVDPIDPRQRCCGNHVPFWDEEAREEQGGSRVRAGSADLDFRPFHFAATLE